MAGNSGAMKAFLDWVNAETGLPPVSEREIDYGDGDDHHGDHGHDAHGHDAHGHDAHGHDDHGHDAHGHDAHGAHDVHEHDEHKAHDDKDDEPDPDYAEDGVIDEEFDYSVMFAGAESPRKPGMLAHASALKQGIMLTRKIKRRLQSAHFLFRLFSVFLTAVIIAVLLLTLAEMPEFGNPRNPTVNEVYSRYIERGVSETGAINAVAAMILDYRAFDTLGESVVLFTAVIAVIMLLRALSGSSETKPAENKEKIKQPLILKVIVSMVTPFVLIYGIYIILNGHLSPGGGFSGGAILGAGIALFAFAFGVEKVRRFFSFKTYSVCTCVALLFYALVKGWAFFMGASGLHTGIPLGTPGNILSSGLILPLNICIGIIVSCTVYGIYALFSEGEV